MRPLVSPTFGIAGGGASEVCPYRLLISESEPLVLEGVRARLGAVSDFEIVDAVMRGSDLRAKLADCDPDLLLVDPETPGLGYARLAELHLEFPRTRILVLARLRGASDLEIAFRCGASGFLAKDGDTSNLAEVIRAAARGERYLCPNAVATLAQALGDRGTGLGLLSDREREILGLFAQGLVPKEIADRLGISARTVDTHRTNIMRKLGIHSTVKLVRYAIAQGLVTAE